MRMQCGFMVPVVVMCQLEGVCIVEVLRLSGRSKETCVRLYTRVGAEDVA
jgi:hypothetical protein